jgi:cell wall assembly regulator SMI1
MAAGGVEELLARLDHWLAFGRRDYYTELLPGASDTMLDAFEARFSLDLPVAYRALMTWRNGQRPGGRRGLQFDRGFLPLERVVEAKDVLDASIDAGFEDPLWWRRGWVPILENANGDHLCIDVKAEDGGTPGQLVSFWHDWDDRSVQYPSVERWLEVFVDTIEAGQWHDEAGAFQPRDDQAWQAHLRRHNPGYPIARRTRR